MVYCEKKTGNKKNKTVGYVYGVGDECGLVYVIGFGSVNGLTAFFCHIYFFVCKNGCFLACIFCFLFYFNHVGFLVFSFQLENSVERRRSTMNA